jgi:DNA-binding MarR family transcriptional regulator
MHEKDRIDLIRAQWSRERPDLDSKGFAVGARLLVLGKLLERRVSEALAPLGLSLWAFDVLATLRRQGPPYDLTPTELSRATMLTSGAMTNRLDRLEADGLLRRELDPNDRRGLRVVLTRNGLEIIDRAIAARFQEAEGAASTLSAGERKALEKLLRKMMVALDAGSPSSTSSASAS